MNTIRKRKRPQAHHPSLRALLESLALRIIADMEGGRIAQAVKLRTIANRLCYACVGGAFVCFVLTAVVAKADWVFAMSIAWGFISGAIFSVLAVLVTSLRISYLEDREKLNSAAAGPLAASSDPAGPSSHPLAPRTR